MHQHHIDANELHQHDVAHHRILETLVDHRVSAVFYHYGLARIFLNIRQRLHQHLCPVRIGNIHGHRFSSVSPAQVR